MAAKITSPMRLMLDISAWQSETLALTAAERGALLALKMYVWRTGPLPDRDDALARIAGMDAKDWRKARKALEPLFIVKLGEWQREDWNDELEEAYAAVNRVKELSRKGNAARWGKRNPAPAGTPGGTPAGIPHGVLNNISAERSAKTPSPTPKAPSQGEGFSGQPEFLEDVLIAESALGLVGGGV